MLAITRVPACFVSVLLASICGQAAAGAGFLDSSGRGPRDLDAEFRAAMASVMGCSADASAEPHEHVDAIKLALAPMWRTLPKNRLGNVEWRILRYATHRYFMQQSSLLVRGIEPTRRVNSTTLGSADILSTRGASVPNALLEGKVNGDGFSLDDVAFMVATLERVIYDEESGRLERAYHSKKLLPGHALSHKMLATIIETYMAIWMLGDDEESIQYVLEKPSLIYKAFPMWAEVRDFSMGMVRKMEFERSQAPRAGKGKAALTQMYSFDDAHAAVGHITRNFASFWETECQNIKGSLTAMDKKSTGRITLSDFYGANEDGDWRFGESEAYLRELGALDETSKTLGPQVILTNYLQGASNCIVTTDHYMICCVNECEGVLNDIETAIGASTADVDTVLALVRNITSFNDDPPKIDSTLKTQLERIALTSGGKVPLHGRLFAQWLHYVFPQECPYPHKAGAASAATMTNFGSQAYASEDEVRTYASSRNVTSAQISDVEAEQWMSQWSEEEELSADYVLGSAPWERTPSWLAYGLGAASMIGIAGSFVAGAWQAIKGSDPLSAGYEHKAHLV